MGIFDWFGKSKSEKKDNYPQQINDFNHIEGKDSIKVEWLKNFSPIYIDDGDELIYNTFYYDNNQNEIFLSTENLETAIKLKNQFISKLDGEFISIDKKTLDEFSSKIATYKGIYKGENLTVFIKKSFMPNIELQILPNKLSLIKNNIKHDLMVKIISIESNENFIFKDILEFLSKENIELFEFVKTLVEKGKKGVKIDQEKLVKLIQNLVIKLVKENADFSKLIKKNDPTSKELAIQGYATFNLFSLVKYLNDKLNEYEDNKFKKWDEIETYYSIYLFIYDTITKEK